MGTSSLLAVELLGGFGAGKTTLCDELERHLKAEHVPVYRQDDYRYWLKEVSANGKVRGVLSKASLCAIWRALPDLFIISLVSLPYVLHGGSFCPFTQRCTRLLRILKNRAFLPLFAEDKDGILLLDEWHINQLATVFMPDGPSRIGTLLMQAFYRGMKFAFVHVEREAVAATEGIVRRSQTLPPGPRKDCALAILTSGDKIRIRACAESSAIFHRNTGDSLVRSQRAVFEAKSGAGVVAAELGRLRLEWEFSDGLGIASTKQRLTKSGCIAPH